ncbi:MAG: hypothetical protein B7Z26_10715, partial [Asticcacaulis sp. 32-58-5]
IVSTFVTPLAQYLCQWLYKRATPGTYRFTLLDYSLPRLMKPAIGGAASATTKVLRIEGLMTTLISTVGLVLTFGIMFPPLGVALAVSLFATIVFFRINVSQFIFSAAPGLTKDLIENAHAPGSLWMRWRELSLSWKGRHPL